MKRFVKYLTTENNNQKTIDKSTEKFTAEWLAETKAIISTLLADLEFLVQKVEALQDYDEIASKSASSAESVGGVKKIRALSLRGR